MGHAGVAIDGVRPEQVESPDCRTFGVGHCAEAKGSVVVPSFGKDDLSAIDCVIGGATLWVTMQRDRIATMDAMLLDKCAGQNLDQVSSEADPFTLERYVQFHRFLPKHARTILDVGSNTGRGGQQLVDLKPEYYELTALDCVQSRLDAVPKCYRAAICGVSNAIACEDQSFDAVVAGEFLEHLSHPMSTGHFVSYSVF